MDELGDRQRVRSVETAARLLLTLAGFGRAASLVELGRASGLAPGKVHRYLASLAAEGLVAQDAGSRAYRLGPAALTLGAAALRQNDIVSASAASLDEVRTATGFSCFCAVFGNRGATVLRQAEAPNSVIVNVRPGSVLPLASSATGRVFAAYLGAETVLPLLAEEVGEVAAPATLDEIGRLVRGEGMARIEGTVLAGISAIAVPVFGALGEIAGALTVLGPSGALDVSPEGAPARALAAAGRRVSHSLGGSAPGLTAAGTRPA